MADLTTIVLDTKGLVRETGFEEVHKACAVNYMKLTDWGGKKDNYLVSVFNVGRGYDQSVTERGSMVEVVLR